MQARSLLVSDLVESQRQGAYYPPPRQSQFAAPLVCEWVCEAEWRPIALRLPELIWQGCHHLDRDC